MPSRRSRDRERAVRFDGFYEDEYEALNDRGFDHMEIIDRLSRADEQYPPELECMDFTFLVGP